MTTSPNTSEELRQITPSKIRRFDYYRIGNTTMSQLARAGMVKVPPSEIANKKPDGLIVLADRVVYAVVEYKQPHELDTPAKIASAIQQEINVAKHCAAPLIVTDGEKTYWINSLSGRPILDERGHNLSKVICAKKIAGGGYTAEYLQDIEDTIERCIHSLSEGNDQISAPSVSDPTTLAKAMWQKIWVTTGKEPEKCLYNVVELFVFKFLSDLDVLDDHLSFTAVADMRRRKGAEEALKLYARQTRPEIRSLFPAGVDGTTIINGTIFVNESGKENTAFSGLFGAVLDCLIDYERRSGSFRYISKDFKTKLYESFLRQSAGVKKMGQYFTPRNVVKSLVRMSNARNLSSGARVCDPFCGVGGFLLETIVECPNIKNGFLPANGKVSPDIKLIGFDKGSDEKEDERTIILAKANMLIYLSDMIAKYNDPEHLKEYSNSAFNETFHLIRSSFGTFERTTEAPYDLILTNPPYVTSGSATVRADIQASKFAAYYSAPGRGLEAISIEWIVKNLAERGQAVVIVPDGLMRQSGLLAWVSERCHVEGIISLPSRTFYATPKATFVLFLTKKQPEGSTDTSSRPVFTYLVTEIGETRDANRLPKIDNDLEECEVLFKQFQAAPEHFDSHSDRCKIISMQELLDRDDWLIDRLWTTAEKELLGVDVRKWGFDGDAIFDCAADLRSAISEIGGAAVSPSHKCLEVPLIPGSNEQDHAFSVVMGKGAVDKKSYTPLDTGNEDDTPVFSAALNPVAYVPHGVLNEIHASKEHPVITWGTNGDGCAGTNITLHTRSFVIASGRMGVRINSPHISPEYVTYQLTSLKDDYGFDRTYGANSQNMRSVNVSIPVGDDDCFDLKAQLEVVDYYRKAEALRRAIAEISSPIRHIRPASIY